MKQVEINGILVEFDEKVLLKQEIKVGDNVQLIKSEYSGSSPKVYPAVVTQILPLKESAAIEVLYVEDSYSDFKIKHQLVTQDTKEIFIVKAEDKFLPFTRERAIETLERDIAQKEHDLQKAKLRLEYFNKYFDHYFTTRQE